MSAATPLPSELQQVLLPSVSAIQVEQPVQPSLTTPQRQERVTATASPPSIINLRNEPPQVVEQKSSEQLNESVEGIRPQVPELKEAPFSGDVVQLNLWQVEPTPVKATFPRKRSTHKLHQSQESDVEQLSLFNSPGNLTELSPSFRDYKQSLQQQELDEKSRLRGAILSELNQLPNQELLLLRQRVSDYLATAPLPPPPLSQQVVIREEIEKLSSQISSLWQEQTKQVKEVESMQKQLFGTWNKNYEKTAANLNQTMSKISQLIVQKDGKENQIHQWVEQSQTHQMWKAEPRTIQMQEMAELLRTPQIQEKLTQAQQQKVEQQKELQQHRVANDQSNKQQRGRPRL